VNVCGSLFSGIGGLDEGLRRAGWEHAFFCESDAYRRDVLRARFLGVPVYSDVREVGPYEGTRKQSDGRPCPDSRPDQWENCDLLCGGFPCQDLSVAGQRRGLAGERSGLFYEFARIIDALRPRWILIENVPGLLSSNGGRDFGVVLGTLADLGYGVAWRVLDSRFFGVPQRRRRVFILGTVAESDSRAAAERCGQILAVGSRCARHPAARGEAGPDVAVASLSGLGTGGPDDNDGQAGRVIAFAGHGEGEATVANALKVPSHGASWSGGSSDTFIAAPLSHGSNPNSNAAGRRREDDENLVLTGPLGGGNDGAGRRSEDAPNLVYPLARRGRDGGSELEVGKQGVYNALRAGDGGSSRLNQVMIGASVRRLTPTECERLQALPDGWTQLGNTADSKRYAALGDAVTVNVAEWIGHRLLEAQTP
jgi:DNA (cytosine-5)-methyltransferase 1